MGKDKINKEVNFKNDVKFNIYGDHSTTITNHPQEPLIKHSLFNHGSVECRKPDFQPPIPQNESKENNE